MSDFKNVIKSITSRDLTSTDSNQTQRDKWIKEEGDKLCNKLKAHIIECVKHKTLSSDNNHVITGYIYDSYEIGWSCTSSLSFWAPDLTDFGFTNTFYKGKVIKRNLTTSQLIDFKKGGFLKHPNDVWQMKISVEFFAADFLDYIQNILGDEGFSISPVFIIEDKYRKGCKPNFKKIADTKVVVNEHVKVYLAFEYNFEY